MQEQANEIHCDMQQGHRISSAKDLLIEKYTNYFNYLRERSASASMYMPHFIRESIQYEETIAIKIHSGNVFQAWHRMEKKNVTMQH